MSTKCHSGDIPGNPPHVGYAPWSGQTRMRSVCSCRTCHYANRYVELTSFDIYAGSSVFRTAIIVSLDQSKLSWHSAQLHRPEQTFRRWANNYNDQGGDNCKRSRNNRSGICFRQNPDVVTQAVPDILARAMHIRTIPM